MEKGNIPSCPSAFAVRNEESRSATRLKPTIVTHPGIYDTKCRHGCDEAIVGIYHFPEGCVCLDDQVQALCHYHMERAASNLHHGPMTPLVTFTRSGDSIC